MMADRRSRLRHVPRTDPDPPQDLTELLAAVASGEEAAMSMLYRATGRRLLGLALQILRDWQMAEEVMLDIYARVWREAGSYDPSRGTPLVWLLMLTRSRALDMQRQRGRRPNADDVAAIATDLATRGPCPDEHLEDEETALRLRRALHELPRGQREALAAAYFGGLTQQEIASTLDVPLGTVKSRMRRGLAALRDAMESTGDMR